MHAFSWRCHEVKNTTQLCIICHRFVSIERHVLDSVHHVQTEIIVKYCKTPNYKPTNVPPKLRTS